MQTLIKWPGGKTSEFDVIKKFIPSYNRYIEPFFGGGAVYFNMQPQKSIINDISVSLMQFYKYVKNCDRDFVQYLYRINEEWTKIKEVATEISVELIPLFIAYRNDHITETDVRLSVKNYCMKVINSLEQSYDDLVFIDRIDLIKELKRTVSDKIFRTLKNEIKNEKRLTERDLQKNFITGFTSGYYMHMRNVFNNFNETDLIPLQYKIAVFYFVREFCYGSMFRYNKSGKFNIPYGGIGYNTKNFKKKIDLLFSAATQAYFEKTDIYALDFEEILDMAESGDFVFLDPPYDTDFSDYENRIFGEKEHRRLEKKLHNLNAKFLLVIKNTELISELYKNNGYHVYAFDNKYSYCVKGRNDRNAVHLIVTNYDRYNVS